MSPMAGLRHILASHTEMSSSRADGYPQVPSTLNAAPDLHDYDSSKQPPPNTIPRYTPYLGLRARLSQTWINKWTILLLLVLCRVLLALKNLDRDIDNAKAKALTACTSVENVGSAMASAPHYMSLGVNALAADGVTKAVNGLIQMLLLTITGVEEIVLFVINMLTSTYICLLTLVVDGALEVAIQMIEDVTGFFNRTIGGFTASISSELTVFQSDLQDFLNEVSKVTSVLGGSITPPTIDLSSQIQALNGITVDPATVDTAISSIPIPTFAEVQNFTNSVISTPFEMLKKVVNESIGTYTFDQSIFPTAQKQALTFCSDNPAINDFFDGLGDTAILAKKIFIAIISVLALLACVPMAYRELWRWRTMQQRSLLLQKNAFDPMDVLYIASRPYTSTAGIKTASKFKSTKRQILTRWAFAYATSIPALFVLALGVAGLFSALCQFILLRAIEREVPILSAEVGDFANTVVTALETASEAWAVSANHVINSTNTNVNNDVFGWVNISTTAVNDTLNAFVNEYTTAINATFGGTILYIPIMQTLNCLVGLKINSLEKGLTWVKDNAHVTFPEFRPDVFSLGAAASLTNNSGVDSFLSSPGSVSSDDVTAAVVALTNVMSDSIYDETMIALALVGIWLIVVLIGVITALFLMLGRDKTRAEGGAAYTGEGRVIPRTPRSPEGQDASRFPAFEGPISARNEKGSNHVWVDTTHPGFDNAGLDTPIETTSAHVTGMRSPIFNGGTVNEKMGGGKVGRKPVLERRGHERESSYGYLSDAKR